MFNYKYKMSPATATIVIFVRDETNVRLLLGKRAPDSDAFPNKWGLIGGFLNASEETLEDCAAREIFEETALTVDPCTLTQIGTLSNPKGSDPRYSQVLNTVFATIVDKGDIAMAVAGDDIAELEIFDCDEALGMKMAFDHEKILSTTIDTCTTIGAIVDDRTVSQMVISYFNIMQAH